MNDDNQLAYLLKAQPEPEVEFTDEEVEWLSGWGFYTDDEEE